MTHFNTIDKYLEMPVDEAWEMWAALYLAIETDRCPCYNQTTTDPEHIEHFSQQESQFSSDIKHIVFQITDEVPFLQKIYLRGFTLSSILMRGCYPENYVGIRCVVQLCLSHKDGSVSPNYHYIWMTGEDREEPSLEDFVPNG